MAHIGIISFDRPSTDTPAPASTRHGSRRNALRAGIATALVALMLMVGVARPADAATYKSDSLVCQTLEAAFQYTFSNAAAAKLAGNTQGFIYWNKIAQSTQGLWFDMGCGEGSSGGGWQIS